MKPVLLTAFLFVSIFKTAANSSMLAQKLNSLPEFECTLLDIKNARGIKNFYGLKKFGAVSLRSTPEKWYLEMAKISFNLKAGEVKKRSDLILKQTEYVIAVSNYRTLTVSLSGLPPSRNGTLRMTNNNQEIFSGRVTCH